MIRKGEKTLFNGLISRLLTEKCVHFDDANSRNYNCVILLAVIITSASRTAPHGRLTARGQLQAAPARASLNSEKETSKDELEGKALVLRPQWNIYRALYT